MLLQGPYANAAAVRYLSNSRPAGKTISDGYVLPRQKQGVNDQRFFQWSKVDPAKNSSTATLRYEALQGAVSPSVRRYNLFWSSFETSSTAPSDTLLKCPAGTVQVLLGWFVPALECR